jgi:hypothetical protein
MVGATVGTTVKVTPLLYIPADSFLIYTQYLVPLSPNAVAGVVYVGPAAPGIVTQVVSLGAYLTHLYVIVVLLETDTPKVAVWLAVTVLFVGWLVMTGGDDETTEALPPWLPTTSNPENTKP